MSRHGWTCTRLTAALAGLALLLLLPASSPAALQNIDVLDDEYNPTNSGFDFLDVDNPNTEFDWGGTPHGSTTHNHTVNSKRKLFKSGAPRKTGDYELEASAGTYPYFCTVHGSEGMKAKFSITPNISNVTSDSFRVIWANAFTTTGNRFDVRYRIDGGAWKKWFKRTRKTRAVFGKNDKPIAADTTTELYEVSVRSSKGKPSKHKRSGYSPAIGPPP